MSRSYREPVFKDSYGTRHKQWAKREANQRIRRTNDVPDGKAYRKYYDPWNIVDFKSRWDPWPTYRSNWRTGEIEMTDPVPEWKARRK